MADKQNRTLSGSFHTHTPLLAGNIPAFQGATGAVLYTAQNLTEAQKAQARINIGAATVKDVIAALPVYNGEVEDE